MVNFDVRQYKALSIRSQSLPSDKQKQIFRRSVVFYRVMMFNSNTLTPLA